VVGVPPSQYRPAPLASAPPASPPASRPGVGAAPGPLDALQATRAHACAPITIAAASFRIALG
jgi:hypothetical protein